MGNGWIADADEASLSAVLGEALSDLPKLDAMGQRSFELVRDRFNVDAMVSQMIAAARFALDNPRTISIMGFL